MSEFKKDSDKDIKCVSINDPAISDFGKHILLPYNITLCGIGITGCQIPNYPQDLIFNDYKIEKWDITCENCLELIGIIKKHHQNIN